MAPFWKRLVQPIPDCLGKEVIWIHGVSVGEIKSAAPLYIRLRASHPDAFFLVTTTTTTGQAEARRSLSTADAICYLPIDFPWIVSRWVSKLKPKLFLLIESDFWPFLLHAIRKMGGKNILVSGKISEKSANRFKVLSFFSKKLFGAFDLLCVQNEEYEKRFLPFITDKKRLQVLGNLKLDISAQSVDIEAWREKLQCAPQTIAITCTHAPEEEEILEALLKNQDLFFFLAPRHPDRFEEIAELLEKKKIPFCRFTELEKKRGDERVILIDVMGKLPICYALSRVAIVCGSFTPIGGHNVLEPCLYGIPVIFGPHMHTQVEFTQRVLKAEAGFQVEISQLLATIDSILMNPSMEKKLKEAALEAASAGKGVAERTHLAVESLLK